MQLLALWHEPRAPFAYPLADDRLCVRLRMARDDTRQPFVLWSDRFGMDQPLEEAPMVWLCDDASYRYWHAFITLSEGRARYTFRLDPPAGASDMQPVWYSEAGPSALQPDANWPDAY
ncbi:MAG: alpha amylase N-terminal ig-like domain-containing protein, partial [Ktedonobacterales bacterium]